MFSETALDKFIDDVVAGGTSSDTGDPAAQTIVGLARFDTLRPPAAGKAKTRQMMLARARELQKTPAISRWRQRLTAVIAAATAMTMLSGGAVYAASGSAPGDLLYPVKRAAEDVSISFKPPGIARAQAELDLARIRLAEIKMLVKSGDKERIGTLVRELNGNLTAAGGWRSRLTPLQRQQIETGAVGLRRAIKSALPVRKIILRPAGPRTIRKNPAPGTIQPKSTPRTIQPEQAPPATRRLIDRARPALQKPAAKPANPRKPAH
ncbi:MAG: DUF5667 domain-containing protein [Actinomycetota bacterium]|nr:DUF5667 domain-containing protein [Actinomycetota bacterium]